MADFNSERQGDARRAYGDAELSRRVHGRVMETFNVDIRKNGAMRNRAIVLGGLAGLCTATGAAAMMHGAPHLFHSMLESDRSLRLLAWSLSGGLGIGYVVTAVFANERAVYDLEFQRELWEIDNHLTGELTEMISIYRGQGLSEEEAHVVTRIFAKQKKLFASLMMVEELGYSRLEPPTITEAVTNAAIPSFVGYAIGLMAPLLPLLLLIRREHSSGAHASSTDSAVSLRAPLARVGGLLLGIAVTGLSCLQSEVFFGAYASCKIMGRTMLANAVGIGAVYAVSYATARCL